MFAPSQASALHFWPVWYGAHISWGLNQLGQKLGPKWRLGWKVKLVHISMKIIYNRKFHCILFEWSPWVLQVIWFPTGSFRKCQEKIFLRTCQDLSGPRGEETGVGCWESYSVLQGICLFCQWKNINHLGNLFVDILNGCWCVHSSAWLADLMSSSKVQLLNKMLQIELKAPRCSLEIMHRCGDDIILRQVVQRQQALESVIINSFHQRQGLDRKW